MKRKDPENPVALPCGCVNRLGGEIDFCRLHKAAPAMLEALKEARHALGIAHENVCSVGGKNCEEAKFFNAPLRVTARAIRKASGAPVKSTAKAPAAVES